MEKQTFGAAVQTGIPLPLQRIQSAWESHPHQHPRDGAAPHGGREPACRAGLAAGDGAQRRSWAAVTAEDSPLLRGSQVLNLIRHFCYLIFQPLRGESALRQEVPPSLSNPPAPQP